MATFDTLKQKIQSLIDKANSTTGKSDVDLNSGVNSLIEGFNAGECILQEKTVTPTTSVQRIGADEGYHGLSSVKVEAVTSAIDSNITPENIKKGVTILSVTGTHQGYETSGNTCITVSSVAELPADVPNGTIAIVG